MTIQAQTLPDLAIDVETPWPMKRKGKQVYAKLIDFGSFPGPYGGGGKTHNVPDIEWCQISWDHSYVTRSTDSQRQSLALIYTPALGGGPMPWRFLADHNSVQVQMTSNKDYREWDTIILCLLYTKTSDGAESGQLVKPGPDGLVLTSREGELVWEEAAGGSGCECEIAAPQKSGLAPEGGAPGQVYQVNPEGNAYEWRPGRLRLDSDTIFYVRKDGDDCNDGLSPQTAVASIAGLDNLMRRYDVCGYRLTIDFGTGVWEESLELSALYRAARSVSVHGAGHEDTVIDYLRYDQVCGGKRNRDYEPNVVMNITALHGLEAVNSGCFLSGTVQTQSLMAHASQIDAYAAKLRCVHTGQPSGNMDFALVASCGGWIRAADVYFEGNYDRVVHAVQSFIQCSGPTSAGVVTGMRYSAVNGGIINTGSGVDPNFFPGSQPGIAGAGGLYF